MAAMTRPPAPMPPTAVPPLILRRSSIFPDRLPPRQRMNPLRQTPEGPRLVVDLFRQGLNAGVAGGEGSLPAGLGFGKVLRCWLGGRWNDHDVGDNGLTIAL